MAISGISVIESRHRAVDYLYPYMLEPSAVALKISSNKLTYFLDPFSLPLWGLYVCSPLLLAVIAWGYQRAHLKLAEHQKGTKFREKRTAPLLDILFLFVQNMLLQGEYYFSKLSSHQATHS